MEAKVETFRRERANATRDLAQEKVASGDLMAAAKLEMDDRDLRIVQLQQHITQTAAANDESAGIRGSRSACPDSHFPQQFSCGCMHASSKHHS